jgi:hypothetical protein
MTKGIFAVALLASGLLFTGHGPGNAAATSIPGMAAPLTKATAEMVTPVRFRCVWDLPIISAGVAFFELLRDEEGDRHCTRWHFNGEHYYRRTYHGRSYK